jgi:hypothetical protein
MKGRVNVVDTTYQSYADFMQDAVGKPTIEISRLADDITNPQPREIPAVRRRSGQGCSSEVI